MGDAELTRVVLIRPGDVLVISGIDMDQVDYDALSTVVAEFKQATGISYMLFTQDPVEIEKLSADELRAAAAALGDT